MTKIKMPLDEWWVHQDTLRCPVCSSRLWVDRHQNRIATHYCEDCNEFTIIKFNQQAREKVK